GTALAVTVGMRRQDPDVDRQNAGGQGGLALLDRGGRGLLLERLVAGVSRCSHEERTHSGTSDQASSGHLLDHASPENQLRGIDRKRRRHFLRLCRGGRWQSHRAPTFLSTPKLERKFVHLVARILFTPAMNSSIQYVFT